MIDRIQTILLHQLLPFALLHTHQQLHSSSFWPPNLPAPMCLFLYQPPRWNPKSVTPKAPLMPNTIPHIQLQDPTKYITKSYSPLSPEP